MACQVRRCTQANADLACASQAPQTHFLPLATVAEPETVATRDGIAPQVQDPHAATTAFPGALEPLPLATIVAGGAQKLNRMFPSLRGVGSAGWPTEKRQTASVATSLDTVKPELRSRFISQAVQEANIESVALVGGRFSAVRANLADARGTGKTEVSRQIEGRPGGREWISHKFGKQSSICKQRSKCSWQWIGAMAMGGGTDFCLVESVSSIANSL